MKTKIMLTFVYLITILKHIVSYDLTGFLRDSKDYPSNHYAVLVAGSNSYWNYRHQADIYHSYQLLIRNGIPADNIIVFAYDDIAYNRFNPIKGKVFNHPDFKGNGTDVYQGVVIDYKGEDVNPKVFLDVIQGNPVKVGSKRTLLSDKNDNVFIYFSDHGAPGLIAFPDKYLYADDFIAALKYMNKTEMYSKMVIYIEACESGSMFANLPNDINIYATTAANDRESSYAIYCEDEARIGFLNIGSCLGDLYSVSWLEDSDSRKKGETLLNQFKLVKKKTKYSHVQQFGSNSFEDDLILDYQGINNETTDDSYTNSILERNKILDTYKNNLVNSRDAKLHFLYNQVKINNDLQSNINLQAELHYMNTTNQIFNKFNNLLNLSIDNYFNNEEKRSIKFECLKQSIEQYKKKCNNLGEYTLKYIKNIVLACNNHNNKIVYQAIEDACSL